MSCIIIKDIQGRNIGVQDENGNPSELFEQILGNPHVKDFTEALGIYQNTFSEKIRTGQQNVEFFTGKAKEASSNIPYSPVLDVDQTTPVAKAYNLYTAGGNFTGHISKMIAGFQEKQKQVAEAIVKGDFKSFLDIGTSEGGMIKTVASQDKNMVAVGVDPNREMLKNFNSTPAVPNAEYRLEAFQGSWTEDDGTEVREFKTSRKFDVVNEDFAFQFINNNRAHQVAGVKELMNKDGVFITSEKFHTANEAANEAKKYDHQRKYFSPDQLTEDKQTIVSGMADDMVNDVDYFKVLKDNFKYVVEYWNAGNFKGYLASDNEAVLNKFKQDVGDLSSEFTDTQSLTADNNTPLQKIEIAISEAEEVLAPVVEKLKEPSLVYQDAEGIPYTTFQEALRNTPEGSVVMGIFNERGFQKLASIETNANIDSKEGIINSLIKDRLISGESFIDTDGKKVHKVAGEDKARRAINSDTAIKSIRQRLGVKAAKALSNGDIVFDDNHTKRQFVVTKKDGSSEYVTPEDMSKMSFKELQNKYEDATALVTLRDMKDNTSVYGEVVDAELPFVPENELQVKLMALLKEMGVKSTSIADYVTKYGIKNGLPPSAQALADLANNVIAFKDGVVQADDLLEETAHFIVAQTPEAEKADLKRNIHKSSEWVEFQASYREIYGQTYSGEELEDIVREEILGKVLKNAVKNKFQAQTEVEQNIYNKVLEYFKNFFTKVDAFFKGDSQQKLNNYTTAVYNNLMNDTLSGMLSGENNRHYTLYSTTSNTNGQVAQTYKQMEELLHRLTQQQQELSKKYNSPGSTNLLGAAREQMENLEGHVEEVARLKALANLAMVANSQTEILTKVVKKNLDKGYHFSQEENSVYQNLTHKVKPLLNQINVQLEPKTEQEKRIKADIESTLKKLNDLEGNSKIINSRALDAILDRVIKKNSFTDAEALKYKEDMKAVITTAQKDTQFLHANLGSLTNAKNGFLNLAGDVIERVQNTERGLFLPRMKEFLNNINKIGFDPTNLKKFIKNGFIINEVDAVKEKLADSEDKVESYNSAIRGSNLAVATTEDIDEKIKELNSEIKSLEASKADKNRLSDLVNARQTYNANYKIKKKERFESYFSEDYLKKLNSTSIETNDGIYTKMDLPLSAIEADKHYRAQVTEIRMNAEGGVLTAADADSIKEVNRQRLADSFARDSEGKLKRGLVEYYDTVLDKYVVRVDHTVPMSDSELFEANKVFGLQMISLINQEFYKNQPNLNGIPTKFLDALNKLSTEKEKWDFVQLNSYLGFEDSFWESFKREGGLVDRLRAEGHDDLIEDIRSQQQIITSILKKNRVFNSPSETDANEMSQLDKDSIKNAQSILENKFSTARGLLKDTAEESTGDILAESATNEAYKEKIKGEGIESLDDELNFILSNVTSSSASYIDSAKRIARAIKDGEDVKLNKTFSQVFEKIMTEGEVDAALLTYAKSKLLPYYKRTEPIGYSSKLAAFKEDVNNNVPGTVESLVAGKANISSELKVSPSFSFFESTEGVNKQWLANRDAGRPQHSQKWLNRVRDDEFYDKFGVNKVTGERTGNLNQKDWETREELLKLQDWTLDNYRLTGTNVKGTTISQRYFLPQQRKNAIRRGVKGLKLTMGDMVGWREDEQEYGQDITGNMSKKGSTLLTIPTYGINKIADQSDVTDQLLDSYMWMAQQSALHRARKETIGDMLTLNDLILNSSYEGKEASATNTYKMFKSYLDANFYGVHEGFSHEVSVGGKSVDLGKIAKTFNNWVIFSSLAGVTIPAVSLTTGKVAEWVEKAVGETINPMAYKKAHVEFLKESKAAAAEIGGFTSHAKLNVIMEAIGVYNSTERFQNSTYNRAMRTGLKTSSGMNEIANFPVTTTAGLSVIYDNKYYNNDIVTFDQFRRKNPTKDIKTIKEEWEALDNFYDDWVVRDGVLSFDKASISKKIQVADLDELLNLKLEGISSRATGVLHRIDARVPDHIKSIAGRDSRANFFLTFLNWFTINAQVKLKSRHYNHSEQTFQEGNWRSALNFITSAVMNPKDIKQVWKDSMADDVTRVNLKRTAIELGVANALAVAAMLLANYADDDEDPSWLLAWSSFMMDKAAIEQIGSTVAIPRQIGEILTQPLVATQKVKDLADIMDVFSSDTNSRGEGKGAVWARKNLPFIRDYKRLKDPKTAAQSYKYFSEEQTDLYDDYAWLSNFFDEE